ncbi:unnamed protein product [Lactuca saligna]|uniref:Uncharacterized protein n=1 Tax=Lactuca saligna TaxID=75948 RepID=A0AA35VKA9_LACSI|nr:unnamed protein product [Lactuca saligna]
MTSLCQSPLVKVWLGDNADHYYVLSRFLLSRMLTVTKIPNHVALKISLELKKLRIYNSLLDVAPLTSSPIWACEFSSSEELITEFCRECRIVQKAGDLKKAMKDGKPIIIEGMHVDPSIYLMDEENKSPHKASKTDENDLKDTENNAEISKT